MQSIDACHDEITGKLIVYLTWVNGQKTQHGTKIVYTRCPQKVRRPSSSTVHIVVLDTDHCYANKMLQFYEQHVKIVKSASEAGAD